LHKLELLEDEKP